jgi:hypothetical protein
MLSSEWYTGVCSLIANVSEHCSSFISESIWRILLTYSSMKMKDTGVPKRWHLKYRRRWITQKKAYNIQNEA